jgi:ThiF family protein
LPDPVEIEAWRDALAGSRSSFEDGLRAHGFVAFDPNRWRGTVRVATAEGEVDEPHIVELTDDFPFSCPKVTVAQPGQELTWHTDLSGNLCLYRRSTVNGRPWETVDGLIERIVEFHANAAAGWPDDPGELDLDSYFGRDDTTLITYDDAAELVGRTVVPRKVRDGWYHLEAGSTPNRGYRRSNDTWAYAVNVGLLERPYSSWADILGGVSDDERIQLERFTRAGKDGFLVVRYQREGTEGRREACVALKVNSRRAAEPEVLAVNTTEDTRETRRYRGGPDVSSLWDVSVAIVGCGAIGSFLAEQLARAGVGRLVLVDPQQLLPGNCVRHLAPPRYVPLAKVDAIKKVLVGKRLIAGGNVEVHLATLTPDLAFDLTTRCDLIVDAAADEGARGLLEYMADLVGTSIVRVALLRDGGVVRVQRYPLPEGTRVHGPIPALETTGTPYREAGCGDPVSPTPPYAVAQAAGLATRMVVDSLRPLRRRTMPHSIVEMLEPQPDAPYNVVGVVDP